MTKFITLVPAYGRDYRSISAVKKDWEDRRDFIVSDHFSGYNGKPANKTDLTGEFDQVNIRYNKLRKIAVIKL